MVVTSDLREPTGHRNATPLEGADGFWIRRAFQIGSTAMMGLSGGGGAGPQHGVWDI